MSRIKIAALTAALCFPVLAGARADEPKPAQPDSNSTAENSADTSRNDENRVMNRGRMIFRPGEMPADVWDYLNAVQGLPVGERYILGVELEQVPKGLHRRLGLEEESGLIVQQVYPDKPAAKAGVQQYDLLLKIDGKSVSRPGDVVRAINESKGKPVTVTLLRDSEPFDVEITPELASFGDLPPREREPFPQPLQFIGPGIVVPGSNDLHELRQKVDELQKQYDQLADQVRKLSESKNQD